MLYTIYDNSSFASALENDYQFVTNYTITKLFRMQTYFLTDYRK
jgi:hypothetical protein